MADVEAWRFKTGAGRSEPEKEEERLKRGVREEEGPCSRSTSEICGVSVAGGDDDKTGVAPGDGRR